MTEPFVPNDFPVPTSFEGEGFHLEPLGPHHNERDHEAWMSSVDHIRATPGFEDWDWPEPMTSSANLEDLERHARDFADRTGFTYSVVDADEVIGCVYIYPDGTGTGGASVRSWVTESRADMDVIVWRDVAAWIAGHWPFSIVLYAPRE